MTKTYVDMTVRPFANKLSGDCRRFRGDPVRSNTQRRYKERHLLAHTRQSMMAGKVYGVLGESLGADVWAHTPSTDRLLVRHMTMPILYELESYSLACISFSSSCPHRYCIYLLSQLPPVTFPSPTNCSNERTKAVRPSQARLPSLTLPGAYQTCF
jgi:hypothetical protein